MNPPISRRTLLAGAAGVTVTAALGALAFDLAAMPHLLIGGSTGTGKSVCLHTIIVSLLLTRRPDA